jgi:hypothetical protein
MQLHAKRSNHDDIEIRKIEMLEMRHFVEAKCLYAKYEFASSDTTQSTFANKGHSTHIKSGRDRHRIAFRLAVNQAST